MANAGPTACIGSPSGLDGPRRSRSLSALSAGVARQPRRASRLLDPSGDEHRPRRRTGEQAPGTPRLRAPAPV